MTEHIPTRQELSKKLPPYAFIEHPATSETVAFYLFKNSYYFLDGVSVKADAAQLNAELGITEDQAWIFTLASFLGWDIPDEGERREAWIEAITALE